MGNLRFTLFGRFHALCDDTPLTALEARKPQELLCYLLLNPNREHYRETLANLLWEDSSSSQSKQYLRQTLWHLNSALESLACGVDSPVKVESDWIQMSSATDYWCDVEEFDKAYAKAQGVRGRDLTDKQVLALELAVELYQGDLLQNWYEDWCILERERHLGMYMVMLDKLMSHSEVNHNFEQGIVYGSKILLCDVARERTYRRLMRLYYLSGDRTRALRTYGRCRTALESELGVEPAKRTVTMYKRIRDDRPPILPDRSIESDPVSNKIASLPELLDGLLRFRRNLADMQRQVERDIERLKETLA